MKKETVALLSLLLLTQIAGADSFDLRGVTFSPGHPIKGESLVASVVAPDEIAGLKATAASLRKYPDLYIEISGHVDQYECQGIEECQNLGLRRAVAVYRHLLTLGINPRQVVALREFGSTRPIAGSATESWVNSRTELNIYSDP